MRYRRTQGQIMDGATLTIIGTVLAVGIGLAGLMLRTASRQDRRMDRFEDSMGEFRRAMDTFRTEMQRLAEGRLDERGSAAD